MIATETSGAFRGRARPCRPSAPVAVEYPVLGFTHSIFRPQGTPEQTPPPLTVCGDSTAAARGRTLVNVCMYIHTYLKWRSVYSDRRLDSEDESDMPTTEQKPLSSRSRES